MLQLQLKNLVVLKRSKKVSFFFIVSLFSFFAHIIAVLFVCIVLRSDVAITIDTKIQDAPIMFVPFLKEVKQISAGIPAKNDQSVSKKEPPKIQQAKNLSVKKETPKSPVKKNNQSKVLPKNKAPIQSKKKSPIAKKVEPMQKKVVEKKEEPIVKEKLQPKPEICKPSEPAKTLEQSVVKQETVLVGMQDREIFIMQDLLKKDILSKWKRPTNIPEDALCQYRVKVYKNGTKEVILEKSSQALALDMSARNFLIHYDFPDHWVGKDVSIIF